MSQISNVAALEIQPLQVQAWLEKHLSSNMSLFKKGGFNQPKKMTCMSPWG